MGKEKELCESFFMSYFHLPLPHSLCLLDPCISEVIINLTDSIITFALSALIPQPTQKIKPPPLSLSLSVPSPIFSLLLCIISFVLTVLLISLQIRKRRRSLTEIIVFGGVIK